MTASNAGPKKDPTTGTWSFVCDLPPGPEGQRRQARRRGFPTKKAAGEALDRLRVGVRDGTFVEPSKLTVGSYLRDKWLPAIEATVRPSTFASYRRNLRLHVLPALGGLRLQSLTGADLQAHYGRMATAGNRKAPGTALSARTVRYVGTIMGRALSDAAEWGLLVRNPADTTKLPRAASAEMHTWSAEQLGHFLHTVRGDRLEGAWVLAATTGMRRGEILGLHWADVDLGEGSLAVRTTLTVVDSRPAWSTPKTARGVRNVDLDPLTVDALRAHRARQAAERLAWGPAYSDADLVFARENGSTIHPDRLTHSFTARAQSAGLPRIRLHDLRHSYATVSLRAGVRVEVVSRRLGHSRTSMTQDVYTHAVPAMEAEAASRVASLIFGVTNS